MNATIGNWEAVIGLEIHAQLKTRSKIFCACAAEFGGEPNTRCCPVCLGLPGALPVLNERAVEFALRVGLALDCSIASTSILARKNYFYPDLPKGYQISQFDRPLAEHGHIEIVVDEQTQRIGITRVHIEEDAGKSIHGGEHTHIDLNRCGTPLIEIVSEPDMRRPEEAHEYLLRLRQILTFLDVCDGNMEEGSLRCDANLSVRQIGERELGQKTELKNLNSFRGVEAALGYEFKRQVALIEAGGRVVQETLLWDAAARETRSMRSKEEAHDYRYFPEPDLLPLDIEDAWLARVRDSMPELPAKRMQRFVSEYGLPAYDADVLTAEKELADYYEEVASGELDAKQAANWVMGEVLRRMNERSETIADFPVRPQVLSALLARVNGGQISNSAAKSVFENLVEEGGEIDTWIEKLGLSQISDSDELAAVIDELLAENPDVIERFRTGEKKLLGWFVGQVMAQTRGKANPQETNRLLREKLSNS